MPARVLGKRFLSPLREFRRHGDCHSPLMPVYHVTISVRGRRSLAPGEAERRELVRAIVATGGRRVLLFCLVDDHLHLVLRTDRPGYLIRDLHRVLRSRRPDLELKPAHREVVATRAYLRSLVRYVLRQPAKHGLATHSALWTGSCFQDLVGARLLSGFDPSGLREELPRFRLRAAYEFVGLEPVRLVPADDEALRRAGAARLVDLAAGVFGVGPDMREAGLRKPVAAARALAAGAGCGVGLAARELAHYLGVQPRSVRLLARKHGGGVALLALRRRLALEDRANT